MLHVIAAKDSRLLAECLKIRNTVFTLERGVPQEIEVDSQDISDGECDHFLIEYEGKSAGALRCMRTGESVVKLQRFCILKEFRLLGLGRKTVAYIEDHYREMGISRIEMDAKYEAYKFYEKCGYQIKSEPFMEAGILHVKMRKDLQNFTESVPDQPF